MPSEHENRHWAWLGCSIQCKIYYMLRKKRKEKKNIYNKGRNVRTSNLFPHSKWDSLLIRVYPSDDKKCHSYEQQIFDSIIHTRWYSWLKAMLWELPLYLPSKILLKLFSWKKLICYLFLCLGVWHAENGGAKIWTWRLSFTNR